MGSENATHYEGQEVVEHECGRTIRLNPRLDGARPVYCGSCSEHFQYNGGE